MENNNERQGFQYTYSAKEQEELRRIREKYTGNGEKEDKMERLRRLDTAVTRKALCAALILGIFGALMLGSGMSIIMTDLGELLCASEGMAMLLGLAVGITGGALASLAFPVYNATVKRERKRIAPEVIRLTDELMK